MLGFDTWSGGDEPADYLKICHTSEKYARGNWLVLTAGVEIVSAIIVYRDGFNLPAEACGIGSLATSPQYRGRGYGSALTRRTIVEMTMQGFSSVYLFSDIDVSFYERLGFKTVGRRGVEVCMCCSQSDTELIAIHEIEYF
jgi:ribosomal protein S18 acetylase RimI-like enzyme